MSFTFGTDPEFMIQSRGALESAIGILPNKEKAIHLFGHHFYYDNVLAEIAVKPAKTKDDALANIRNSLMHFAEIIRPARFIIRASANYPVKELRSDEAKIAGCNPEWDVYSLQMVFPPDAAVDLKDGYYQFKTPFRSAGGHIHVGNNLILDQFEALNVIRMMDIFIGVPSIFMDTDKTSKDRRKIYGLAGTHRMTDYGLEYRPLSNFWFASPEHVSLIYDLTEFCVNFVEKGMHKRFWSVNEELLDEEDPSVAYQCTGYDVKALRKCINSCDKKMAEKFMIFVTNFLPARFLKDIEALSGKELPDPYTAWEIK